MTEQDEYEKHSQADARVADKSLFCLPCVALKSLGHVAWNSCRGTSLKDEEEYAKDQEREAINK